jgi:hypothetical protein
LLVDYILNIEEQNKDLEKNLSKFKHICGTIRTVLNETIRRETQIIFYRIAVISTLRHISETWTFSPIKKEAKVGNSRSKISNECGRTHTLKYNIKKGMIRNELNIFNLNNGLNWIRHVGRMEPENIQKQFMDCTTRGTRSIGRLRLRWKDQSISQMNGSD